MSAPAQNDFPFPVNTTALISFNSLNESKSNKYFQLVDISNLLDYSENSEDYYSDWVHYTPISREIIVKRIFQDIEKKIKENLNY